MDSEKQVLWISITKEIKDLAKENHYKALTKIRDDTGNENIFPIERTKIVKMVILPKALCRLNANTHDIHSFILPFFTYSFFLLSYFLPFFLSEVTPSSTFRITASKAGVTI